MPIDLTRVSYNRMTPSPSNDDLEELLLSCRYGELEEFKAFVDKFGASDVANVRDENGNTVLHMACGNGHNGMQSLRLVIGVLL